MTEVDNMMGALFYRRVPIPLIKDFDYRELKYWFGWHKTCEKEEAKLLEALKVTK